MPARQLNQLVKAPGLARTVSAPIGERFLLRHSLQLFHCRLNRNGRNPCPMLFLRDHAEAEVSNESTHPICAFS